MEYLLGIDMGTSSVKTGIFDRNGNPAAFCDASYPLYTPKSGWAEQKVEDWWSAICKTVHGVVKKSGIAVSDITGMSVDTTGCTVLAVDENMNILRPALLWMDTRATEEAKLISATKDEALKQNGGGNASVESMPAKIMWLKRHEPDVYKKAAYVFECVDWLMFKLTGELNASMVNAAPRWYYDSYGKRWPTGFYKAFGMEDVLEKFPERVLKLGTRVGKLTKEAAKELGLSENMIVGEGGLDAFVGMVGLSVVDSERLALITGTSHLLLGLSDKEVHFPGMWGSYLDVITPGRHMIEGGQISTGAIVSWFKKNFCANIEAEAEKQGRTVYDLLNEGAEKLPIGAEGLLVLDYFQGNRTPYADPDVRGMIYGLSLKHTPYHIYRAMIEGICYGTNVIMEVFKGAGVRPKEIYAAGGAAKSRFWLQTHADVCGLPICLPRVTEAPCLGSAILGAVASGLYQDIEDAAKNMVSVDEVIEPDEAAHEQYMRYYEKYKQCYLESQGWMHDVTNFLLE